jgi:hypothetical protein
MYPKVSQMIHKNGRGNLCKCEEAKSNNNKTVALNAPTETKNPNIQRAREIDTVIESQQNARKEERGPIR